MPRPGDEAPDFGKDFTADVFLPAGSIDFSDISFRSLVPWWKRPLMNVGGWLYRLAHKASAGGENDG